MHKVRPTQVLLAGSACGPRGRGKWGTISTPCLAWSLPSSARRHCGYVLDGEQYPARGFRRSIGKLVAHLDSARKTGSGFRLAHAFQRRASSRSLSSQGCACRSWSGFRVRFALNTRGSNASGYSPRARQSGTLIRIADSAFPRARQPSFAAIGTSLCTRPNTISTLPGQPHTRSHKNRSASVCLP